MRDKVVSMCLCLNDCEWYNRVYIKGHMYKTEEDYNCYAGEYYYDMMSMDGKFLSYVEEDFFDKNFVICDGALDEVDKLFDKIFFENV